MSLTEDPTLRIDEQDHSLGSPHASVTIVEYGEFECPHCGRAHFQLKSLRDRLEELDARFVWRHFARDEVHPYSIRAAVAAEAAGAQGKFWAMHDRLFEHQHSLEYDDLRVHASMVGIDVERFLADMRDETHLDVVRGHGSDAVARGITSTPTFFINDRHYKGDYRLDDLVRAIEDARG